MQNSLAQVFWIVALSFLLVLLPCIKYRKAVEKTLSKPILPLSVQRVSFQSNKIELRGWLTHCSPAITVLCQHIYSSCQALTASISLLCYVLFHLIYPHRESLRCPRKNHWQLFLPFYTISVSRKQYAYIHTFMDTRMARALCTQVQ